jgi:transcriptional regulator with XRE-family HTH domain
MRRWVSSRSYRTAIERLVAARNVSGITQRELADRLRKPPSFVAKIELGERRLDIVEFIAVARALGLDPSELMKMISADLGPDLDI